MLVNRFTFLDSVASELDKAGLSYKQDYAESVFVTDFLIEQDDNRVALECKFNVHRDFEKTGTIAELLKENFGWDVQSRAVNGEVRFIEVKVRAKDATTVTKNEILASLNQPDRYYLAIVIVDGDDVDGPHYIQCPFDQELGFGVTSVNIDLPTYLQVAEEQAAYGK